MPLHDPLSQPFCCCLKCQALFKCLNYLTDARDLPLLQAAYPCLIDLIDKSKTTGSKERYVLYEKMLADGVVPGLTYAGNKSSFLLVLLEAIDKLTLELGTLLVRYLKVKMKALPLVTGVLFR
jgi:hypothetical protein